MTGQNAAQWKFDSLRRYLKAFVCPSLLSLLLFTPAIAETGLPESISKFLYTEQALMSLDAGDPGKLVRFHNPQMSMYKPESRPVFKVKSYWLDESRMTGLIGSGMSEELQSLFVRRVNGKTEYRLLVHPETEEFYRDFLKGAIPAEDFWASPTASSRTSVVWKEGEAKNAFLAKLSLDVTMSGADRTIKNSEVALSIGVNNLLEVARSELPKSFEYMPEVFGVMPKGMPRGGMIIRSFPHAFNQGGQSYVPLFSLYATPPEGGPPLLAQMIRKSGMEPSEFIRSRITRPFAEQWIKLAIDSGITMEPHSQNVLMGLGDDRLPNGKFMHRDFGGFNVDLKYRRSRSLALPVDLPVFSTLESDYYLDQHAKMLDYSLETYFSGGFLYDLDKRLPDWKKQGWIPDETVEKNRSQIDLLTEFSKQYETITGKKTQTRDLSAISKDILKARKQSIFNCFKRILIFQ